MIQRLYFLSFVCTVAVAQIGFSENFPQFRGISGSGQAIDQAIPLEWSAEKNIAWKIPMDGSGWSQPIIWNGQLYLTSAVADGLNKPKRFSDGVKMPQSIGLGGFVGAPDVEIAWTVQCIEASSGKEIWRQSIAQAKPPYPTHPSNTFATETPVADEQGVYVWFGALGKLVALTHQGQLLWQRDFEPRKMSNGFGTGSSVAIHEGKLYLQSFSEENADVFCVDCKSGEIAWQKSRAEFGSAWSSPIVWKNEARAELIISAGDQVDSYDPTSGELLWTVSNVKAATACSVCADASRLYFGGSDPFSKGSLFAVKAGASGNISPSKKNSKFEFCDWVQEKAAPGMASPTADGKCLYVIDKNILRCYDAMSGERLYQERVPGLEMVAASLLVVGDKILLVDENGSAVIVAAGREFKVLGGGKIEDTFWSTPAVADGSIYVRGVDNLYCIRTDRK